MYILGIKDSCLLCLDATYSICFLGTEDGRHAILPGPGSMVIQIGWLLCKYLLSKELRALDNQKLSLNYLFNRLRFAQLNAEARSQKVAAADTQYTASASS